ITTSNQKQDFAKLEWNHTLRSWAVPGPCPELAELNCSPMLTFYNKVH
ncbi:16812_t:CDS:2, partial [Gigaspora margarita]